VRRVVETIDKRKDAITELRQTFESIHSKVDTAIEASSRLVVDGKPVDMEALDRRMKTVEDLRASVQTNVTGFENRITQLQKSTVTQAQLNEALGKHKAEVSPEQVVLLQSNVSTVLRTEFKRSFETLGSDIGRTVDVKLASVDARVAQRIDERLPAVVGPAFEGVKAQIVSSVEQLRGETKTAVSQSAAAVAAVKQDLTGTIATLQTSLTGVRKDVDLTLPRLTDLQSAVTLVQRDTTSALAKVTAHATEIQTVRARAEQIALQSNDAVKKTEKTFLEELDKREVVRKVEVDKRLNDFEATIDPRIDRRVEPRLTTFAVTMTNTAQATASEAAVAALARSRPQLDADIIKIARDQAFALKDEVAAKVRADVEPVINERVAGAVRKAVPVPGGTVIVKGQIGLAPSEGQGGGGTP
jgi:hypothetical protein